ncbi:unnamed protein product [Anisakis simplex]|uniref:MOR2-PAG1_N domain-containing protein n=1 Tax=Anisakis simplex TaxID=6269 RepID=A0A0M3JLQ5_ANISI|nr:unnamed protein product [Anisakis simplex]
MRLLRYLLMDRLANLFDLRKDFDERKMTSDHTKQSLCLLMAAKSLIKSVPISIEKFQSATLKFIITLLQKHEIHEKLVLREVWTILIDVARHGSCDSKYTNFLKKATLYIVATIGGDDPMVRT